jgi:uncharacterized protein with beta-barrel porin domain
LARIKVSTFAFASAGARAESATKPNNMAVLSRITQLDAIWHQLTIESNFLDSSMRTGFSVHIG